MKRFWKKLEKKSMNTGLVLAIIVATVGALIMGFGMSKVMIEDPSQTDMLMGIIIGVIGLIICVLDFPIYAYLKQNK